MSSIKLYLLLLTLSVSAWADPLRVLMIDAGTPYLNGIDKTHVGVNRSIERTKQDTHTHADAMYQFINRDTTCSSYVVDWCNYYDVAGGDEAYYHCLSLLNEYDIVNMSLAGIVYQQQEMEYISGATRPIIIASAGNDGTGLLQYPAKYAETQRNVLAISALNLNGGRMVCSNYSDISIDFVGVASYNTREGKVAALYGTSIATALYTSKLIKEMCPTRIKRKGPL